MRDGFEPRDAGREIAGEQCEQGAIERRTHEKTRRREHLRIDAAQGEQGGRARVEQQHAAHDRGHAAQAAWRSALVWCNTRVRSLSLVHQNIISCTRCRRLRHYCEQVARDKKAAHRAEVYWGRPVPGFGDPNARLLVLGLAPAAHGANRTGRVFTGDGPGASGDFLMTAMHAAGFASLTTSRHADDGLILSDAYIAAAVRCAPPGNKPLPEEIVACQPHLEAELAALPRIQAVVALGRIAFDVYWRLLDARGVRLRPRPVFAHGAVYEPTGAPIVIASYHPSRQNTNTGKLTAEMLAEIFTVAESLVRFPNPERVRGPDRGPGARRPHVDYDRAAVDACRRGR